MSTTFPENGDKQAFVDHLRKAGLAVTKDDVEGSWNVKIKFNNRTLFSPSGEHTVVPEQLKPMLKSFLKKRNVKPDIRH